MCDLEAMGSSSIHVKIYTQGYSLGEDVADFRFELGVELGSDRVITGIPLNVISESDSDDNRCHFCKK